MSDWRKLTRDQRNEIWPTLTHGERDAIIEADRDVVNRIDTPPSEGGPTRSTAGHTPQSEGSPTLGPRVTVASGGPLLGARSTRVTPAAVLVEVRSKTCYEALRGFARAMAILGYIGSAVLFVYALRAERDLAVPYLVASLISFLATAAGYQSTLLFVDLVDLHLSCEARRRNHDAQT